MFFQCTLQEFVRFVVALEEPLLISLLFPDRETFFVLVLHLKHIFPLTLYMPAPRQVGMLIY